MLVIRVKVYKTLRIGAEDKTLLQPPINDTIDWARLVTFVYVKFSQMLILKVVCNNSLNGLQCYSFRIFISACYGWDMSNESWGLFLVFFGHDRLRPPHVEPYEQLYRETKIKPHNLS